MSSLAFLDVGVRSARGSAGPAVRTTLAAGGQRADPGEEVVDKTVDEVDLVAAADADGCRTVAAELGRDGGCAGSEVPELVGDEDLVSLGVVVEVLGVGD